MALNKHLSRLVSFFVLCLTLVFCHNAMAQSDNTWQPIQNNTIKQQPTSKRVVGEIIGGLVGVAPALGVGAILGRLVSDDKDSSKRPYHNHFSSQQRMFLIASALTPMTEAIAVHMVGDHSGSLGKGWTPYAGGAVGGVVGGGLGALGFLKDTDTAMLTIWAGSAAGALIGALLWYELSNYFESQKAISNLHPTVSVSDQYTSFGIGVDF